MIKCDNKISADWPQPFVVKDYWLRETPYWYVALNAVCNWLYYRRPISGLWSELFYPKYMYLFFEKRFCQIVLYKIILILVHVVMQADVDKLFFWSIF